MKITQKSTGPSTALPTSPSTGGEPAATPTPPLFLERQATRQYIARNGRGAEVLVGDGPGRFSPGDLLKIALGACNAMSSDVRLQRVLGEAFTQFVGVSGAFDDVNDRYDSFEVELVQDLSGLSEADREALVRRADAAIDRNCTIGHTITRGVTYTHGFTSEPAGTPGEQ